MIAYHFISEKYALNVVSDLRLKVSLLDDMNDPFELNAVCLPDRQSRQEAKKFKEYMADRFGILCFSKRWKNPLLWRHYANRHKGVAIEFEIEDSVVLPIKYRKSRYALSLNKEFRRENKLNKKDIEGIWLTKYESWRYEEELRVIVEKSDCIKENGFLFYPLSREIKMKGFVLGPFCEITIREIQLLLPAKNTISVIKSRLASRSFDIVTQRDFKKKHLTGK